MERKSLNIESPNLSTKCTNGYKIPRKPLKLWCGQIPEIYGYGIMVLERTEDEARKSLKRMYYGWKKSIQGEPRSFNKVMEYYGGRVFEVETGKQYYDDLGS